jgi:hypothetical protein
MRDRGQCVVVWHTVVGSDNRLTTYPNRGDIALQRLNHFCSVALDDGARGSHLAHIDSASATAPASSSLSNRCAIRALAIYVGHQRKRATLLQRQSGGGVLHLASRNCASCRLLHFPGALHAGAVFRSRPAAVAGSVDTRSGRELNRLALIPAELAGFRPALRSAQ